MAQNKRITPQVLRRWPLPKPSNGSKDDRGKILVVAGSAQMPGPVILAATSALRAGAGKLQIATDDAVALHVAAHVPEALVTTFSNAAALAEHADAIVFGPGMDKSVQTTAFLKAVAEASDAPVLVDAAGFEVLKALHTAPRNLVLTPHAGEMAQLLSIDEKDVEADGAAALRRAVERFGATVALKSRITLIAAPESPLYENTRGHWGLATSGSGDTLAGIIGGILARGVPPLAATCWGVYLHATAGERLARRMGTGFLAREIPAEIPRIMKALQP